MYDLPRIRDILSSPDGLIGVGVAIIVLLSIVRAGYARLAVVLLIALGGWALFFPDFRPTLETPSGASPRPDEHVWVGRKWVRSVS